MIQNLELPSQITLWLGLHGLKPMLIASGLLQIGRNCPKSSVKSGFTPKQIRLPLDMEWTIAAGGDRPEGRYPWDKPGKATTDVNEIIKRANIGESKIGHTTPVNQYLRRY